MSQSEKIAEMTLGVEQGGTGIEAGDTCQGTILETNINEFESGDDQFSYYELVIEETGTQMEFNPDWPARITPQTGLGQLVQRFGADLQIGAEINLHEIFEPGQQVEFEMGEEESSDPDDDSMYLRVEESTVRPVGEELDDPAGGDSSSSESDSAESDDEEGDDAREYVLRVVDDLEGSEESEVKQALAKMDHPELDGDFSGGDYIQAYKSLVSDGDVVAEDGIVMLG